MTHDFPAEPPKRRLPLIRIVAILIVLVTAGVLLFQKKQRELVAVCENHSGEPKDVLNACDTLLAGMVRLPETVSLIHRHKMRVYMRQKDWTAADTEAELAIAADPDSEIPWQWKARIFSNDGDDERALEAIDMALELDPKNGHSLQTKYNLLLSLERHAELDGFVSKRLLADGELSWLPNAEESELFRLLRNPEVYPMMQAAFLKDTLNLRDQLAADPADKKLRRMFLAHCRVAPASCPPLYPERRESYLKVNCDQAIDDFDTKYPIFMENLKKKGWQVGLRDFVANEPERATVLVQSYYLSGAIEIEHNLTPKTAESLLVQTRMFDCVSGGEFLLPERHTIKGFEPTYPREEVDIYFGHELRRNLVDLAQAYLN